MRPAYKDLYFGKSDSRNEINSDEEEFIRSFVDLNHVTKDIISGEKTLVLGPKGTGKSALAWYLKSTGNQNGHVAEVKDASTLPLADIPRLTTGQPPGTERTVTAWKFILLCNYLELLLKDQSCQIQNRTEITRVTRLLKQYGLLGDTSGKAILDISKTSIQIPIPKIGTVYKRESSKSLNIFTLLPYLEDWASNAVSDNRHIMMLDGLDSIFLNDKKYDESLASLVQAAYSINQKLRDSNASGSIVLLIRNDVFSRISMTLPDSQKMRDDFSVELDWRILSGAAGVNAPLVRLVNQKSAKALDVPTVSVLEYFPNQIQTGGRSGAPRFIDRLQYFMNLTRHTPRDLLRLFEEIRKVEASGNFPSSPSGQISKDVLREGVLQYSTKYFVGAIRNEFAGYENGVAEANSAITALQSLEKHRFTYGDFKVALSAAGEDRPEVAQRLINLLFFAGAIGNSVEIKGGSYLQFYHRRDDTSIYLRGNMVLHTALSLAWSIPF